MSDALLLFKKYNNLVTWFANTEEGRRWLKLSPQLEPIHSLLPNGLRILKSISKKGDIHWQTTVYPRNTFAKRLAPALGHVDTLVEISAIKHAEEAKSVLLAYLGLANSRSLMSSVFLTTTTVYPDADPESTTVDGHVRRDGIDEDFSTIRAGGGTASGDSTATDISAELRASATTNQYDRLGRCFFLFDTSAVPTTDTKDSATFSLFGQAMQNSLSDCDIDLVASTPTANTSLQNNDFGTLGTTRFATGISTAVINLSGYNDWTLNASGLAAVTAAGITKFGVRLKWDLDNSFGGVWSSAATTYFRPYYADQAGTTNDPKLVVNHTTPGTGVFGGYGFII